MSFPLDTSAYKAVAIDPFKGEITPEQKAQLLANIQVVRDTDEIPNRYGLILID